MKKTALLLLLLLIVPWAFFSCKKKDSSPKTQIVNLKVDGYTDGASKGFQAGFATGETAEVTLGPLSQTYKIKNVQFLFGGKGTTPFSRDVVLKVYKDIGVGTPGAQLYSNTYSISASDDIMQQIDLSDQNIIVNGGGSVRIALEMTAAGVPSVAVDKDGTISTTANWIKSGASWVTSASLGVSGDFIIRATVEENL